MTVMILFNRGRGSILGLFHLAHLGTIDEGLTRVFS